MGKGITPVIAVILLLLITVALMGFAAVFFKLEPQTAVPDQTEHTSDVLRPGVRIESVVGSSIAIRNIGSINVNPGTIALYVNAVLQATDCPLQTQAPNAVFACGLDAPCMAGDIIRATSPDNEDERICG